MRVAVIGLGVIGRVHARILRENGSLSAVCDIDAAKLAEYTDAAHYTDYTRLLDDFHPDAVHICTPHYLHAPMILSALEKNIHVLCEKPMAITSADAKKMLFHISSFLGAPCPAGPFRSDRGESPRVLPYLCLL